jgi:hypothetical protein
MPFEYVALVIDEVGNGINFYPHGGENHQVQHADSLGAFLNDQAEDGWEPVDSLPISYEKELNTLNLSSWLLILRRPKQSP